MKEIFKDIPWYEWIYQVSNTGKIRSFKNGRWWIWNSKILSPWKIKSNYLFVVLSLNWNTKQILVHRLVWQSFLWLDINNKKIFVCHKDDNPLNNNVNNLFLWTQSDNMQDCISKWRRWGYFKLNKDKVKEIKIALRLKKKTQKELSIEYNIDASVISDINRNKIWKNILIDNELIYGTCA